uniref:Uncharacterized protein n=1 Tax=Bracon brevicornis TaxID=1563983 RepID=A0A6V7IVX9_9HYME
MVGSVDGGTEAGSECGVGSGDGAGEPGEPTDGTGGQSPPVGGPREYDGGPPGGVLGASVVLLIVDLIANNSLINKKY